MASAATTSASQGRYLPNVPSASSGAAGNKASSSNALGGSFLSPSAQASGAAAARLRNKRSNHPRQSSGVYNTFSSKQIHGFKEAFAMLDQDRDGLITREDLKGMLDNLGE